MHQVIRNKVYTTLFFDYFLLSALREVDPATCIGAELTYRLNFLEAAREVGKWKLPDSEALEKAWKARRVYRDRVYRNGSRRGDYLYPLTHVIEASKHRGRVQAMEMATQDWKRLSGQNLKDNVIRCSVILPWLEKIESWAKQAIPLDLIVPARFPIDYLTPDQRHSLDI